jgi:hypothetical protein
MNKTVSTVCLVLLQIYLSIVLTISAPETAIVTHVPGFNGTIPSKHYAGYEGLKIPIFCNFYSYFLILVINFGLFLILSFFDLFEEMYYVVFN